MKALYESILDSDFDINDDDMYVHALMNLFDKKEREKIGLQVTKQADKFEFSFKNKETLLVDCDELTEMLKKCPIKKIVFNGITILSFSRCNKIEGYDFSAEEIIVVNRGRLVIKDCYLRSGEDIYFRGINGRTSDLILDNTLVWGLACTLNDCDLQLKTPSQLNISYELAIKNPTPNQFRWLKKHSIPLRSEDIQNEMMPDMWTDPLSLISTTDFVTDYVVVSGRGLDYIYKFYSIAPDHIDEEITSFDLASGWTLNIDNQE